MDTTEEKNTQNCTPDEACCCDTAAEQAPVTVEMIEEAFEHAHRRSGVNPIAAILGIAGCECKECKD